MAKVATLYAHVSPDLHKQVKLEAINRGLTLSEFVRQCVEAQLRRNSRLDPAKPDRAGRGLARLGKAPNPGRERR